MSIDKKLLKIAALIAGLFVTTQIHAQSYVPEWNDKRFKVQPLVPVKAYSFDLEQVRLLNGPFRDAMAADKKYLLSIDPDRLLSGFRSHSGLKPNGALYEGWESSGLAGHTLGHYLSAISMHYASTKDPEFLKRVNYIVDQLHECQQARKTGYIGAIPKEDTIWSEVEKGNIHSGGFDLNGGWSPWYTVHKIMAGLLDAYLYADNEKALKICTELGNWTGKIIRNLNDDQLQKMLRCEYGGMPETLVNLYAITGDKKYLGLSYKFYDKRILDSLGLHRDILAGKHSNTQIPKAIASERRYELTGNNKDEEIATFFWKTITENHSYATGGNSNYEYLSEPGKLSNKLTDNTTETCNTYNMLKLTRHLFAMTPSAALMDYYEKALYNHILASQNHEDGMMCYFVSLRMGGKKEYSTPFTTFTCCVGSGMENHVKYNESIYFRGNDGSLYINLFIPSMLNWKEKGIVLIQKTGLPDNDHVDFTVQANKPVSFPIRIRKPRWASSVTLKINGVLQSILPDTAGYLVVNRKWKNNDHIELTLAERVYTEAMPDNSNRKAIFYGPVLLAGVLGETEPDPLKGIPVFVTSETDPNKWLKMVDRTQSSFMTSNTARPSEVKLIPFNRTKNQYYSVYWDVFTPQEWAVQQKIYDEQKKKQQEMELKTVDLLRIGEMQPERDHNVGGENIITGEDHQKKWRATEGEGNFSFQMKTDQNTRNTLINTYWGTENRGRIFDILIDGVKLTTVDLNQYKESRFYDISYPIPAELTKGKENVTIKFVSKPGNGVGPFYGCRIIRD